MATKSSVIASNVNTFCSVDDLVLQVQYVIDRALASTAQPDACLDAIKYHFSAPGQQVRAKICLDICLKLNVPYDDMLILGAVVELLHNASLIHDDIQDSDDTRRGQPAVWKKFGTNLAICAGDLLISLAYGVLANLSKLALLPPLIAAINAKTTLAILGQAKDIAYKSCQILTIEEYCQIAIEKSGALLSLPLALALIAAEKTRSIEPANQAAVNFAIAYQIADDLQDTEKDLKQNSAANSVNIVLVLKHLYSENPQSQAALLCEDYLNKAIYFAQQLPDDCGANLVAMASNIKNQNKAFL